MWMSPGIVLKLVRKLTVRKEAGGGLVGTRPDIGAGLDGGVAATGERADGCTSGGVAAARNACCGAAGGGVEAADGGAGDGCTAGVSKLFSPRATYIKI